MFLFNRAIYFIAWRYMHGTKKQRFASFVALLATLGIAIGVCALIVVSSIMQGLQDRLKSNILSDSPHVVVKAQPSDIKRLLDIKSVIALVPFVEGEAMIQYENNLSLITLQASDYKSFFISLDYADLIGITKDRKVISRSSLFPIHSKDHKTHAEHNTQTKSNQPSDLVSDASPDLANAKKGSDANAKNEANDSSKASSASDAKSEDNVAYANAADGNTAYGNAKDEMVSGARSMVPDTIYPVSNSNNYTMGNGYLIRYEMPSVDSAGYKYGSIFDFEPGKYQVAINYRLLNQLDISNLGEDKVRIVSTRNARYTPLGLTPVQRNFIVEDIMRSLDNSATPAVIGNYEDVRKFFRLKPNELYYRLYLTDPFLIENVASDLTKEGFEFTDWRDRYGEFFKAVGLEKITMSLMLCLIIIVAAFNILSSLTMLVSSRVNEIAILKTIGLENRSILAIFIMEGMSASVVGSILGVIFGIPLAINAQAILNALGISVVNGELPIEIDVVNVVTIVCLCMVVSILCTFYPAYYASKADPVRNLVVS